MHREDRELDEEIRAHLALAAHERIQRGEDPAAARRAALDEFGSVMSAREAMRRVWIGGPLEHLSALGRDVRIAVRSLARAKIFAATVIVMLALGTGANAAMFAVVREVLLRPLVNREEDRLIYIRHSAPGVGTANATFSLLEIQDIRARTRSFSAFGEFSTIDLNLVGLGEPRVVQAGVVGGSYFEVMGLRPALGRLLDAGDEGADAPGAVVLTHRFWSTVLLSDPSVIGRRVRLGSRAATVVGVLEPSVPYPADTQVIANVVTSPHHLGATMVRVRTHRMTELFARLAPGVSLEDARRDVAGAHDAMRREHPDAYPATAGFTVSAVRLRDGLAAPARTALILLLGAAGLVFLVACANVANLVLARGVRRERELAVRAALGASAVALRRSLLSETLVLCGTGAAAGILIAHPVAVLLGRYASRFSIRALDARVDGGMVALAGGLAILTALALACVPRLPGMMGTGGTSPRRSPMAGSTVGRLRRFAVAQVALSFVLVAGAGALMGALTSLQRVHTGYDLGRVLAVDVPLPLETSPDAAVAFMETATRRIRELDGVEGAAAGNFVPWRDASALIPPLRFAFDGALPPGETPHARLRIVTPGFFSTLGIPLLAGRDFTLEDDAAQDRVVVVSDSLARRWFPGGEAVGRHVWWTDPVAGPPMRRRIVGVVADADDVNVVPSPAFVVYHPFRQMPYAWRLFVRAESDPYALVPAVTAILRRMSADQPVERAATLADVRTEVLGPERVNTFVFTGFAGLALLVAMAGVAGVLALSVAARTREFGVRLAIGATPSRVLRSVLGEGARIGAAGLLPGAAGGLLIAALAGRSLEQVHVPGLFGVLAAGAALLAAALAASFVPAARAARVDVTRALRPE